MRSVYLVRHKKAGILTEFAFEQSPTREQLAAIMGPVEARHGEGHWVRDHAVQLLGPTEIPVVAPEPVGNAGLGEFRLEATGTVTDPK